MQKRLSPLLLIVSVWLVLSSFAAAQAVKKFTVQVPFDFHVRSHDCAAGTYVVLREGPFLSLRDNRGRMLGVVLSKPSQEDTTPSESKLVFFEYHNVRVLTQIRWQGERTTYEFVPSGRDEEVARQLATAPVTSAQVGGKP